ncbi:MAG: hypothetical protein AAB610_02210 [Patescibacteria group bacterium]
MKTKTLNELIEFIFAFSLESESAKEAGTTKEDIVAGGKNKMVGFIRRVAVFVVIDKLEYDKKVMCPHFGNCSPANVHLLTDSAREFYEADSDYGKNFKAMADATLAAVVKKFGEVDDIKFKDEEGASGAGDENPAGKKPRTVRAKKIGKKTRRPYKKRGVQAPASPSDSPKPKLLKFVSNGEVHPMIALLIHSYLQTNPKLNVKDVADAFGLSVELVEQTVGKVVLELRDVTALSPEAVCIRAGIERLRVLTASPKK